MKVVFTKISSSYALNLLIFLSIPTVHFYLSYKWIKFIEIIFSSINFIILNMESKKKSKGKAKDTPKEPSSKDKATVKPHKVDNVHFGVIILI